MPTSQTYERYLAAMGVQLLSVTEPSLAYATRSSSRWPVDLLARLAIHSTHGVTATD